MWDQAWGGKSAEQGEETAPVEREGLLSTEQTTSWRHFSPYNFEFHSIIKNADRKLIQTL